MSSPAQPEAIRRFWDKYLGLLHRYGIAPSAQRWYVRRAELYIESVRGRRLGEHRPADLTGYLVELGRLGRMEDWQFRQAVDAIQKLFELVGVTWLHEVDWQYWLESARSLPAGHPTIARSQPLGWADEGGPTFDGAMRWASFLSPTYRSTITHRAGSPIRDARTRGWNLAASEE